jgi:dihydroxy-acid dehydratase
VKAIAPDNPIVKPLNEPLKKTGHLQILYGNLAPEGSVAKITGKEGLVFEGYFVIALLRAFYSSHVLKLGTAKVYDSEELMLASLARKEITPGMVVVIRYEGPKGGPGEFH